ncbi:MAG TPA: lamin tail domain-containing protein [Blastocatellia bacterium]|nr:lamin tail domain-containing protein [Blastocatellia bacterium]
MSKKPSAGWLPSNRLIAVSLILTLTITSSLLYGRLISGLLFPSAHADSSAQALPFSQNWTNTGLITTSDNWSGVPGIEGFRGDGLTSSTAVDPQTVLAGDDPGVLDVNANQANPNTFTTGGVAEFDALANPVVALQGSGTADAPYIKLYLNTTGQSNINVAYNLRDVDGSADNAVQPVALQFRVGSSGSFTNVPAGFVADASTGPSQATLVTPISAALPAAANNQPLVQVRIITTDAVGSDEWIGIDDISVTSNAGPTDPTGVGAADPASVIPGGTTLLTVTVTPGANPTSTGITVTGDLTAIGGLAAQPFFDNGTNGDETLGDNIFSFEATVANSTTTGLKMLPFTVADAEMRSSSGSITLDVGVPPVPPGTIVISQVYGGGGNAGATFTNDFIELFNRSSNPVVITGWTVQYASAAGTTWQTTALSGSIAPGGYYLVQEAAGTGGTVSLPTPDATGAIAMAAGAGKVALVSNSTVLSGGCPLPNSSIVDLVGYGGATCSETSPTSAPGNTTAVLRRFGGCLDTDNNNADFVVGSPMPRNSASPINDCSPDPVAIHDIQGNGLATPFAGMVVSTTGIVTARKSNGFFLQTPNVDADPNTSEGIFVFTSSAPTVAVGDSISVLGEASEFFNLTQINTLASFITVSSSGNPLPAPVALTTIILDPNGSVTQLEKLEGMRVHADALVSVAPTNEFGEIFTVLDGVARPLREPGIEITLPVPPDPTSGVPDCCIPRWDLNPERIMVDSDGLVGSSAISVTSNVDLSNVTGPLDFTFSNYKILPEAPPMTSANMSAIPVPAPAACEFTVAGYNIENFGNNATQRQKAALAIRTVMRYPDIIGHIEILNLASLQALAAQVNSDAVAAGDPNPAYQAFLIPAPLGGTQNVGFLVKTSRVQVDSVTQERAGDTFINPNNGNPETLHDRPPLVLRATVDPTGAAPLPVIVMVNHTRSFIDVELVAGEGPRVRAKRKAQAESVAGLVQELQTNNPTTPVILVGDYNAYQFNDGYTDPIAAIKGAPTPDDQIVVDESPDLVNPNLVNLTDMLPADQRYSFVFEGTPQALDHVLINSAAQSFFKGYAVARSNSDFPESFASDPSRPEKNSDHDMPVAYFRLPLAITDVSVDKSVLWPPNHKMVNVTVNYATANNCGPVTCTLSVTSNEPINGEDDGNTSPDWEVIDDHHVRLRAERSGSGTGRIYTITITCTDGMGGTATATTTVSVPLNR